MNKPFDTILTVGLLGVMAVFVYLFVKGDSAGLSAEEYEYLKKVIKGNFTSGTSDGSGGRGGGGAF